MAEPDRYSGLDFSFILPIPPIPTVGVYQYFDSGDRLSAPYVACDLGMVASALIRRRDHNAGWWPIVKPLVGRYDWSVSPEETGLLTGLKVGVGARVPGGREGPLCLVTFEYGWLKAHDAVGDHDARLQAARFAIILVPIPIVPSF
jgi:hypothetical protein